MPRAAFLLMIVTGVLAGCSHENTSSFQGYVEGEYVYVASSVGGRLDRLAVERGQTIADKAALFELESDQEAAAKRQADEQLKAAESQLADLKTGKRKPEVDVVQAQLAQAVAAAEQALLQLKRDEAQFQAGGISRGQLEDSKSNQEVKAARVRELTEQLEVAKLPARDDQIRAQGAQVEAARAAVSQSSWKLDQKRVAATQGGFVADTMYRVGEWVPAGSPVVRMLPPKNVKVRFFVPEPVAGGLKAGRAVNIHCDGCSADVSASITYVANDPEYTSPIIYSNETRAKLVFLVEARPSVENAPKLRPGQPVSVTLQ
ncbi:MAG TPA: HlyD family efflux transporter periplasmic adaptor subunit [Usitatibacter sp.]|nr:HlyD family efflux transporter periplasmic adaptor subunit [Usitatibacter sp.]